MAQDDDNNTETKLASAEVLINSLAGALGVCVEQISQMNGMFKDEDKTIQDALNEADDAFDMLGVYRGAKAPRPGG